MTPRRALIFIAIAGVVFLLLAGAALWLQSMQPQPQLNLEALPPDSSVMPLDENGIGSQVISGTQVTLRLSPMPAQANISQTVRLIVTDPSAKAQIVTPTLYITSQDLTANTPTLSLPMQRDRDGSYIAQAPLFPASGAWRLRIELTLPPPVDDLYSMITVVNTK